MTSAKQSEPVLHYTREELDDMKALGLPKPDSVSWGDWMGPKKTSHRHDLLIHLAACGKRNKEIAQELDMDEGRVSVILSNSRIKELIKLKQEEYYGKDARKRLEALAGKSIDVFEEVISSPQEKASLKVDVAKYIVDQAVGKAKQDIKVEGSLISELLEKLDSGASSTEREVQATSGKIVDPIDTIVDEICIDTYVVGKRDTTQQGESSGTSE